MNFKKLFIASYLFVAPIVAKSQDSLTGFWGMPFGCSKQHIKEVIMSKFPNAKIYSDKDGVITFTNVKFGGRDCIGLTFGVTDAQGMHTAVVGIDNEDYDVFSVYDDVVSDIDSRYHYHDKQYENWKSPYDKSDKSSYGQTALKLHKLDMLTFWNFSAGDLSNNDDDNYIEVSATEGCNVRIKYQNGVLINQVVSNNKAKTQADY